ncbi:hypothetical protein E2C01_082118 [Portunus trituberculatus]|uniref:Uncharacterized protein n=1 Tax=Portunus trituberculatus TaxID=210409 RepID=A0A5B7IP44_PORTR|nr:hypothetical protein [Portunus trituberculatus]
MLPVPAIPAIAAIPAIPAIAASSITQQLDDAADTPHGGSTRRAAPTPLIYGKWLSGFGGNIEVTKCK